MQLNSRTRFRALVPALVCVVLVGLSTTTASAALMAYDGFTAGGATPNTAAGEYQTGTGFPTDALHSQGPTTFGFDAGAWNTTSTTASFVYYRTEGNQLVYRDGSGAILEMSPGQVQLFRNGGTGTDFKNTSRDLNVGTSLPNELFISVLVQVSENAELEVASASTDGSSSRPFSFGINAAGNPFVTASGGGTTLATNTGIVIDPTQPHLLVAKLTNDGFTSDQIDLYLDPFLGNEGLNSPVATIDSGSFFVGSNASWTLEHILLSHRAAPVGEFVITDEIRVGTTFADVTPILPIPEPATATLGLLGLLGLARRRRRMA